MLVLGYARGLPVEFFVAGPGGDGGGGGVEARRGA